MNMSKNEKKQVKYGRKKSEEKESLFQNQLENIKINSNIKDSRTSGAYELTSEQLENLVSSYTDTNNKKTLLENIEMLGGTKGILKKLKSSSEEGIETFYMRQELFGINKIFEEPPSSFIKFLKESLSELMIVILLSAAIIQIIIGLTILVLVFYLQCLLSFLLNHLLTGKKKKSFMN